jgi:xylulokinase
MSDIICSFDLGTTGVKAGILTPNGRLLATAYREYSVSSPGPQWVEQSVDEMWQAQCQASQEVLAKAGIEPEDIAAIGISCQRATFVPLDKDEKPLTRFIGWQDKRSIEQCGKMKALVGDETYYRIAGLPIEPTAAVSKILWLKENEPAIFDKTHVLASTQNVHLHQLGVEHAPCDLPDAAYIGLLDVDRLQWSKELLDALGIPGEKMPALVPSGVKVGEVSRAAAELTGLAAGTPIVTAGGDLQCAGLGVGVAMPGYVSVGIGTGGGVLICVEKPLRHPEIALNCLPHTVDCSWEMEGIALASGAAYKWFRDVLGMQEKQVAQGLDIDPYDILNLEASQAPAGSNGLLIMPSLVGAGAPNWYPKARGVIMGLTLSTDKKSMIRAMLEGICIEIRWILESAERLGTKIEEVRIWGGAAKSAFWNQISADVYGVPAAKPAVSDAGLVGAAICAGIGAGIFADARQGAEAMVRVVERYEPDLAVTQRYQELFEIYKQAYQALAGAGIFERIDSFQKG